MSSSCAGRKLPLLAALVLAVAMAVPVASASAHSPKASALVLGKIKTLKQQVAALTGTISGLQSKLESLEGKKAPAFPSALAPIGPAGGALIGSYPNPLLAPGSVRSANLAADSVFSTQIADSTILSTDIADHAIGSLDLAPQAVGAGALGEAMVFKSNPNFIGPGQTGGNRITCPAGTKMLSGGPEWVPVSGGNMANLYVDQSGAAVGLSNTWDVSGHNQQGSGANLYAKALCLLAAP